MNGILNNREQTIANIIVLLIIITSFFFGNNSEVKRKKEEKQQRLELSFDGYVTNIILDSLNHSRKATTRTIIINDNLFFRDEENSFFFDKVKLGDYLVKKENDSMARINATFYNFLEKH
ncbi:MULTISPECIES: hypothetical protein [Flavobacterium]|uniref:DUF4369 domain-containing protein n=1 Tax=Flavobacterium jumunjinense TaxID=998845 RepID=A0ABV5GRN6_9FLAO|nr:MULTISPECIES: hypothetical protein [Flavobacterium]